MAKLMAAKGSAFDARLKGHIRNGHNPKVARTLAQLEVDPDENDAEDQIEDANDQGRDEATEATGKAATPPVPSTKPAVPNPKVGLPKKDQTNTGSSVGSWADVPPGKKQMGRKGSFTPVGKRTSY